MKVVANLTKKDFFNFWIYFLLPNVKRKREFINNLLLLLVFIIVSLTINRNIIKSFIVLVVSAPIYLFILLILITFRAINMPNGAGLLGEHIIEINTEGLREITSINDGFHTWKGIKFIGENKKYYFIQLNSGGAHIIPKRAFSSEDDAKKFYKTALNYWKE